MRRLAWVLGGIAWTALVFYVAFRVTFPSDALADRLRYQVDQGTHGQMALDIGSLSPWWVGLKARNVSLVSQGGAKPEKLLSVDVARVRVSPFSLMSDPHGVAHLQFGDGTLSVDTTVASHGRTYTPTRLKAEASGFPINAIPPIEGTQVKGRGTMDLDTSIRAPEGLSKAEGTVRLAGHDVVIEDLSGIGAMLASSNVLPLAFDDLDLRVELTQGKGRVVTGKVASSLASVDLGGDITLDDVIQRSRLHLTLVLTLGDAAAPFAGFLSSAKWSDEKYHYLLRGTLMRPRIEPDRERVRRRPIPPGVGVNRTPPAGPTVSSRPPAPETMDAIRAARERRMESSPTPPTTERGARQMPVLRERPSPPDGQDAGDEGYPDDQGYDSPPPDDGEPVDAAPHDGGPDAGGPALDDPNARPEGDY